MRLPLFLTIVRTFHTFTNATRLQAHQKALLPFTRGTIIKSMPSIPFLSALFGSSASSAPNMAFPDKRSDQEWQAVLNKGKSPNSLVFYTR
jgi:peptide-methionine (R)-S-oxide reductase